MSKGHVHLLFLQEGASPLWWSCYLGRADVATLLLDHRADVDLPTVSKFTMSW